MKDSIQNLTTEIKTVWSDGFMGVDIGSLIVAIGILMVFLMLRGLIAGVILKKLMLLTARTKTNFDDKIIEAITPPVRFIPIALGIFFAGQSLELTDKAADFASQLNRSLIAFIIFWALHRTAEPFSIGLNQLERVFSKVMVQWMIKAFKLLIVFIGASVILELWGIAVAPLLAGLGLFGAAVAFGAQDLFKNLIGGITIIAEKRYHAGDWIKVEGVVEGTVEDIGFRSTTVRRFDKALVHVPNAAFSDSAVTNFSRMTHRRIKWRIGVTYSTSVDQLKIIRDAIEKHIHESDDFAPADEVSTFVRVDEFGDSAITFLIYCFTKTTNWGEWLAIKEDFACTIKEIVEDQAGSAFAFPSQSLYVESVPEELVKLISGK